MIKEPARSLFGGLGLMVYSRRLTGRLRCRWLLTSFTRVARLATTVTSNMLEKTLIILTSTSAVDILLESGLHMLVDDLRLLVLRVWLLGKRKLLGRAVRFLVLEATFGTLKSPYHLVVASSTSVLQRFSCSTIR